MLLVVLLLVLLSLLFASCVMRLFGEPRANVLSCILGVILAALTVQFILDGIHESFL